MADAELCRLKRQKTTWPPQQLPNSKIDEAAHDMQCPSTARSLKGVPTSFCQWAPATAMIVRGAWGRSSSWLETAFVSVDVG